MGRALKRLRESRGFTQEAAAEAAGVTRTAWQNYENGRAIVLRTDMQAKLALALDSTRQDLAAALRDLQRDEGRLAARGVEESAAVFAGPGRQQAIFPTADGDVIVNYPANLSREALAQLRGYMTLFLAEPASGPT